MAFAAGWSFEAETAAQLHDEMGFTMSSTLAANIAPTSGDAVTYVGDPSTKFSLGMLNGHSFYPPAPFQPAAHKGCWAGWVKFTNGALSGPGAYIFFHDGIGSADNVYCYASASDTISLFTGGFFSGSSAPLDLVDQWHYICLKSDQTQLSNWTGELWIDGVQEVTGTFVFGAVQTVSAFYVFAAGFNGAAPADSTLFCGLSFWDDPADPAEVPYYYSTINPNEDLPGDTVGTWTPTEATNWESVDGVLDLASFTTEATPASGENLAVGTSTGSTTTLTDLLGINPASIAGISLHTVSSGQAINARAVIGDGANETFGPVTAIDPVNRTYAHAGAPLSPTGPAWVGSDNPVLNYRIAP